MRLFDFGADAQYLNLVEAILQVPSFEPTRTQFRAKKLFGQMFDFDMKDGTIPILTTKEIRWKAAIKEILWIYVMGSNKISDLGLKIWDEWALPDGTIGNAYGFQARHLPDHNTGSEIDQVQTLIDKLKSNPQDRGMIMNLWNVEDLPKMALRPCAFMTMWDVEDNEYLNCTLIQRSADMPVGVPFNFFQYAVLVQMFAHVTGLKPGRLHHYLNNAHIYENQIDPIKTQLDRKAYPLPKLIIDPNVTNFNDFRPEHFKLEGYEYHPFINMGDVAI